MKIYRSQTFKKQFRKLPQHAIEAFEQRLHLYLIDPNAFELNNHKLKGKWSGSRSINVTGDYRLVLQKDERGLWLQAIGTHSELYR